MTTWKYAQDRLTVFRTLEGFSESVSMATLTPEELTKVLPPDPIPSAQLFAAIDAACDNHYDAVAASRGWGRVGITPSAACAMRANYPNPWQQEAIAFVTWVDTCVAYLISEKTKIISGIRTNIPTPEEAIAELPTIIW